MGMQRKRGMQATRGVQFAVNSEGIRTRIKARTRRRRAKPSPLLTLQESDLRVAFLLLVPFSDSYRQNLIYIC